jgi:hypothetical protein
MHRLRRIAMIGLVIGAATSALALTTIVASSAPRATLLITPTGLSFGPVVTGTTSPTQAVTVTNKGSEMITMTGTGGQLAPPFTVSDDCEGTDLDPGESCHMFYTFSPVAQGEAIATATGFWNGKKYTVKVDGSGVLPTFTISPTKMDFGNVLVGATPQQVVRVTNTGPTPIEMSGTGLNVDPPYTLTENCSGTTLVPGKSCTMTFKFKPTETGRAATSVALTWNGQAATINLEGVGVNPTLLVTPVALEFGDIQTGHDAPDQTVTVTNLSTASLVMTGTGGHLGAPFKVTENCEGVTLKYGQSCTMTFGFHPTVVGKIIATATGTWNGFAWKVKVVGTGV